MHADKHAHTHTHTHTIEVVAAQGLAEFAHLAAVTVGSLTTEGAGGSAAARGAGPPHASHGDAKGSTGPLAQGIEASARGEALRDRVAGVDVQRPAPASLFFTAVLGKVGVRACQTGQLAGPLGGPGALWGGINLWYAGRSRPNLITQNHISHGRVRWYQNMSSVIRGVLYRCGLDNMWS